MGRSDKAKWLIVVPAMLGIVFVTYVEHTTDIWGFGAFICQLIAILELAYGLRIAMLAQNRKKSYQLAPEERHEYAKYLYEKQYRRYPVVANQMLLVMAQMSVLLDNYEQAAKELRYTYDKALEYCRSVRQYSVSPGNFAGGLSTIEEKSMGAVIKSGSRPIQGVIKVSCPAPHPGLWLLDSTPDPYWMQFGITNPNDNEGLMDLASCGAHIVFLVTGRGNVVGSAVAPCIKITGNGVTYARMEGDMDFNANPVLRGECTQSELARRLTELVVKTAAGQPTKSEAQGHHEFFVPYKYQEKQVAFKRACEE